VTRLVPLLLLLFILPTAAAPGQYSYKVIDKKPQTRDTFVQGLEIVDGQLYVSSGGYGKSRIEHFDFASGELIKQQRIDPRLFAEGLTVVGERIYLLTWQSRNLLVFNREDFKPVARMRIPGEGWGLTHHGEDLIYSDGSSRLYLISLAQNRITRVINVTENGIAVHRLNELEWIDGKVWANVWQTNRVLIIDPLSGQVEASIDLQGLLPIAERRSNTDVLNGIARNPADGGIWVSGKNWPWLYRIELVATEKTQVKAEPATDSR